MQQEMRLAVKFYCNLLVCAGGLCGINQHEIITYFTGLLDCWIAGLLGLSFNAVEHRCYSKRIKDSIRDVTG